FTSLRDSEIENPTGESNITSSEHDHYNRIQEALTKFIAECTVEDSTQIPPKPPWKFLYSDIRAVILSGEASDRGLDYIRTILSRTFSRSGKEVLQDSIDPLYVGALGAAKCARAQVENPSMFETITYVPDDIPETP
ncbi:MAG: hypothetical protein M1830_006744, partial [Pleopsidium flavum]